MNPNQYVSVIPSRQAPTTGRGVANPIAPPDGNAQMTLWDYIALAATGAFGFEVGRKIVKTTVKMVRRASAE
jgi:hypothetical protein